MDAARREPPDPSESSFELLQQAKAGDGRALDRLLARYLPILTRWASGRLPRGARDMIETQDIVQDAIVRAVGHLDEFEARREGALQAYLRTALYNRIRDEARRVARNPVRVAAEDLEFADRTPSPLEEVIGRETLDLYEAALAQLRPEDREAVIARVELEMPYEELAKALGKNSADSARMTVGRALIRLAEGMQRAAG